MKRKNKKVKKPAKKTAAKKTPRRKPKINKTAHTIAAITGEETAQITLPIIGDEQNGKSTHSAVCEFCGVTPPAGQYLWLVKKNDVWRESQHIIAPDSKTAIEFLGWDPKRILYTMIAKMPLFKARRAKERALKPRSSRQDTIDKITGITPALTDPGTRIEKEISMKALKKTKTSKKSTAKSRASFQTSNKVSKVETKSGSNGTKAVAKIPKEGTLNRFIFDCLSKSVSDDVIEKQIKKEFPKSSFSKTALNGYRRDLHKNYGLKIS